MTRTPRPETRGVWYACGHRVNTLPGHEYVYSGPMATYCAWHHPMAVYSPVVNKTFWAFGNADNAPTITAYDHASRQFAYPVVLGSNPDGDAHRNPTVLVDDRGFITVFYGAHGHATHVVRSERPYEISAWRQMPDMPEPRTTYPQPWLISPGEAMVSYRHAPGWNFVSTRDGGETWSEPTCIVDFGCPEDARGCAECSIYGITVAESGGAYPRRVHFVWSRLGGGTPEEIAEKHLWARRYNVYYAWTGDGGATWHRSDGTPYTLPISEADAEKVYDCGQRGVWLKDIQLDRGGRPVFLFLDAVPETYESRWMVGRLVDDGWQITCVTQSDHMYDDGGLLCLADDDIRMYGPTSVVQPQQDGGEIEEWQSVDGGLSWRNTAHVTSGSRFSHNGVKVVFGHERGPGDLRMVWSYGDSVYPPETSEVLLYCYGEGMERVTPVEFGG